MVENKIITGKVYVVGDNIDTDAIIPARHLNSSNPDDLKKHVMEDLPNDLYQIPFLNADFSCDYKIVLARDNFGCGSSREHAPIALSTAGISCIIAKSFARIFYRNCVNGGKLLPLEVNEDLTRIIKTEDLLEINWESDLPYIKDMQNPEHSWRLKNFDGPVKDIFQSGGLIEFIRKSLK